MLLDVFNAKRITIWMETDNAKLMKKDVFCISKDSAENVQLSEVLNSSMENVSTDMNSTASPTVLNMPVNKMA